MKMYGIRDIRGILDGKSKTFSFDDGRAAYSFMQQAYHENRIQHIFKYVAKMEWNEVTITKKIL